MNESNKPGESEGLDSTQQGYLGNSPPPDTPPGKGKRAWVDRPEQLLHAVSVLAQASVVAVDAEFTQVRSRMQVDTATISQRLALLQLAVEEECFVVDALRLHDLSPLKAVVENPAIVILLHGAGADLRVMADRDLNVLHYYDLEAASRSIFGQHESSLAAMLQRALHVHLDKSLQRTDWSRRPLPPAMVAYAARDAEMTLALYRWLAKHYSWALQLHDYTSTFEPVASWIEPFLRGTSSVSAETAVAEAKAQGIILSNAQIVG
ncbi:MAG TPA: ribonuclease D, partial [Ktedonobacteraceae bacterium]|nr:ribonuclease D [Ktedonobacteraceae bacterium]